MRTLAIALLASLAFSASAQVSEDAYEAESNLIQLPASLSGSVILRECGQCESHTLRVTANTRYLLNGSRSTLDRLRNLQSGGQAADGVFVVAYDVKTGFATWIALDY